jgi:hypothetical protein
MQLRTFAHLPRIPFEKWCSWPTSCTHWVAWKCVRRGNVCWKNAAKLQIVPQMESCNINLSSDKDGWRCGTKSVDDTVPSTAITRWVKLAQCLANNCKPQSVTFGGRLLALATCRARNDRSAGQADAIASRSSPDANTATPSTSNMT